MFDIRRFGWAPLFASTLCLAWPASGFGQLERRPPADRDREEVRDRDADRADGVRQPGPRPAAPAAPAVKVQPPFELSPREQQFVDELLAAWETQSSKINTFECDFKRWEYDPKNGPRKNGQLLASIISAGQLKYLQPDKGMFRVDDAQVWNPIQQKFVKANDPGEHWVCDGKSVWEFKAQRMIVEETPIPAEMQGKHVADGPLPFLLFGAEASKLKSRYFLRERTDPKFAKDEIWLEAYPRWRDDAANFRSAQMIMKRASFLPYALRLYQPNGTSYTVFEFTNVRNNNIFFSKKSVMQPEVPHGWKLVPWQPPTVNPAAQRENLRERR